MLDEGVLLWRNCPTCSGAGTTSLTPAWAGKSYWMAFSNPRRAVKPGDRVTVVTGRFRAEGLVVE